MTKCKDCVHVDICEHYANMLNHMLGPPEWRINWKYRLHLSFAQKEFLEPYFEEKNVSQISRDLWNDELLR